MALIRWLVLWNRYERCFSTCPHPLEDSGFFLGLDEVGGRLLEWQVLPFGLKCSPRILTRMVRPIIRFPLRQVWYFDVTFMDDMLT